MNFIHVLAYYDFTLIGRPWLIYDHYFTMKMWEPKFDLEEAKIDKVVIWICLLGLSIRVYDQKFLSFLGNRVGKTLKVDATITLQTRGKYA